MEEAEKRPFHVVRLLTTACFFAYITAPGFGPPRSIQNKFTSLFKCCVSGVLSEYFPTDRPSAPAQQREGVPARPTLSTTGHAARPDSGDPTDRLSPAPLAAAWLGRTVGPPDRPTLSEAAETMLKCISALRSTLDLAHPKGESCHYTTIRCGSRGFSSVLVDAGAKQFNINQLIENKQTDSAR